MLDDKHEISGTSKILDQVQTITIFFLTKWHHFTSSCSTRLYGVSMMGVPLSIIGGWGYNMGHRSHRSMTDPNLAIVNDMDWR